MDRGIWVQYGEHIARTMASNKNGRVFIEVIGENNLINRKWVMPENIKVLDQSIQDLLESIYIY